MKLSDNTSSMGKGDTWGYLWLKVGKNGASKRKEKSHPWKKKENKKMLVKEAHGREILKRKTANFLSLPANRRLAVYFFSYVYSFCHSIHMWGSYFKIPGWENRLSMFTVLWIHHVLCISKAWIFRFLMRFIFIACQRSSIFRLYCNCRDLKV